MGRFITFFSHLVGVMECNGMGGGLLTPSTVMWTSHVSSGPTSQPYLVHFLLPIFWEAPPPSTARGGIRSSNVGLLNFLLQLRQIQPLVRIRRWAEYMRCPPLHAGLWPNKSTTLFSVEHSRGVPFLARVVAVLAPFFLFLARVQSGGRIWVPLGFHGTVIDISWWCSVSTNIQVPKISALMSSLPYPGAAS
jgi:hypothetical protein